MLNIKIKNIEILRKIIINIVTGGFLLRFIFQYFFIITLIILFFPYNFQHYNFTALIMIINNILSSFLRRMIALQMTIPTNNARNCWSNHILNEKKTIALLNLFLTVESWIAINNMIDLLVYYEAKMAQEESELEKRTKRLHFTHAKI